mgnify:FL=1
MYNEMEYQEEYRMADLIRRQWLGIITAEEQAELEAWSLQEEHARLYAKIRNQAELQKRNLYVDGLDVDGVWHKLREQIADVPVRKRRFFTRYRVVACLLLLIGVGTLLVYNRYSRLQPSDLLVQSIHPGSSKAVLITNEGKQIILQDSLNQEIQVDESVTVKNTGLLAEYCLQDLQAAEQAEIKYNTIVVPRGGEYEVRLPDGSYVWMNADSEIRFPVVFTGQTRQVSLKGEAYFDVTKNDKQPFIVETDLGEVKVYGTQFNVKFYPEEKEIKATLVEGNIGFKSEEVAELKIKPGYQLRLAEGAKKPEVKPVKIYNEIAWKNRMFCFESERLESIMLKLERWYNVDIIFEDSGLKKFKFSGNLNRYDNIDKILHFFEEVFDVKFAVEENTIKVMRK